MPSVHVERIPVQTLHLGLLGFDHLQIVFRPPASEGRQDDWFVIEGVRDLANEGARLAVEGLDGATTLAEANGGRSGADLAARIGTSESRGARTVVEGDESFRIWSAFVSYGREIDAQDFPYIAAALPSSPVPIINSSSVVSSLLHHAGIDIAEVRPSGLRFSPGMSTLLGTPTGDDLQAGSSFDTLLGGDGDDALTGSHRIDRIDKLFGGRGDDTILWSAGDSIIHGGQPGLAYAKDGVDTVNYAGVGPLRVEAIQISVPHQSADFVVRRVDGTDSLFSVEEIVWDAARDSLSLGEGVALSPAAPARTADAATDAAQASGPALSRARLSVGACSDDAAGETIDEDFELAMCDLLTCTSTGGDLAHLVDTGSAGADGN